MVSQSNAECGKELSYNIRYVDRNGRPVGDPWSVRQVGVYECYSCVNMNSIWIFLQPSENIHRRLGEWIKSHLNSNLGTCGKKVLLHIAVQVTASRYWGDYIEEIRFKIQELVLWIIHSSCMRTISLTSIPGRQSLLREGRTAGEVQL